MREDMKRQCIEDWRKKDIWKERWRKKSKKEDEKVSIKLSEEY